MYSIFITLLFMIPSFLLGALIFYKRTKLFIVRANINGGWRTMSVWSDRKMAIADAEETHKSYNKRVEVSLCVGGFNHGLLIPQYEIFILTRR